MCWYKYILLAVPFKGPKTVQRTPQNDSSLLQQQEIVLIQSPSNKASNNNTQHVPKTSKNVGCFKDYRKGATYILLGPFHRFRAKTGLWGWTRDVEQLSVQLLHHTPSYTCAARHTCTLHYPLALGCFRPGAVCWLVQGL